MHLFSDRVSTHLICTSGINDGVLNVFDMRTNKPVFSEQLHKGAVNQLVTDMSGNSRLASPVITCSADKTCKILDPLSGFKVRGQMQCKDAVFAIASVYNMTVAGCGDGNLLFFDNDSQKCLYGYSLLTRFGAMQQGGVRCLKVSQDNSRLVAAGDDPTSLLLCF